MRPTMLVIISYLYPAANFFSGTFASSEKMFQATLKFSIHQGGRERRSNGFPLDVDFPNATGTS